MSGWKRKAMLAAGGGWTAVCVGLSGGCLQRTISITSNPPGALVWLNDQEVGRTPLETSFTFFGTYDVRLKLEGYEPIATGKDAPAPIYEWPGLDLICEAIPVNIETKVRWHFDLQPSIVAGAPDKEAAEKALIERARETRDQVQGR